jgi:hypothetical protein
MSQPKQPPRKAVIACQPCVEFGNVDLVLSQRHPVSCGQILLQKSKIEQPENLAKVDLWASQRLRSSLAPLRRSVVDFG